MNIVATNVVICLKKWLNFQTRISYLLALNVKVKIPARCFLQWHLLGILPLEPPVHLTAVVVQAEVLPEQDSLIRPCVEN
jgi:hypothetical protein